MTPASPVCVVASPGPPADCSAGRGAHDMASRELSDADRQHVHRQQANCYDEHAAGGGRDSGFQGRVHASVSAVERRCSRLRGHWNLFLQLAERHHGDSGERFPRTKYRSTEHEGIVGKLRRAQVLRVYHQLKRFNPLTRREDTRTGGRGRPYSENPSRDHGGGNDKQSGLAHLSSPVQSATATCG
jgi:hypothetical protein